MAPTLTALAYPLHSSLGFGVADIETDFKQEAYSEVGTNLKNEEEINLDKSKVSTFTEAVATASLNIGIPRIGSGGVVLELQEKIDSQTVAFTSKVIAFAWLLAIPFWPVDMITFAFAFSTILIGIDRAWANRKKGILELPKQLGFTALICIFGFWALGMVDVMVSWSWPDYDNNWSRQFGVAIFVAWGLSVIAKWIIQFYCAISDGDIMQKRLELIWEVARGKRDNDLKK